ncbi:hypothetical protein [Agrobacterium tumefaciens]|uniref:hypothetical protein n=1 Tax=Agrobacterium tumefaciens TaxID=358 RepID=UPI0004597643|nr:hypothetical protein [Agrobacterium tumefaciens]CDN92512.1 hypothetical protein BN949_01657 [Agrobacterium tumefaciens]
MTDQLDFHHLLSATVLAFPPRRLTRWIEASAARVHGAKDDRQQMLDEVGRLQLRYILAGIHVDRAYSLANEFEAEVIAKVRGLRATDRRPDPRGAA